MVIRDETAADAASITDVTIAAFKTLAISNKTEHYIIEALRAANALAVSLVAEVDGRVVGHIAFSPVTISDGTQNWYGLGPVSILAAYQRKGIGQALITTASGLTVAIPSFFFYRYFKGRVTAYVVSMEEQAINLIEAIDRGNVAQLRSGVPGG